MKWDFHSDFLCLHHTLSLLFSFFYCYNVIEQCAELLIKFFIDFSFFTIFFQFAFETFFTLYCIKRCEWQNIFLRYYCCSYDNNCRVLQQTLTHRGITLPLCFTHSLHRERADNSLHLSSRIPFKEKNILALSSKYIMVCSCYSKLCAYVIQSYSPFSNWLLYLP